MTAAVELAHWKFLPRILVIPSTLIGKNFLDTLVVFATDVGNFYYQGLQLIRSLKTFSKEISKTVERASRVRSRCRAHSTAQTSLLDGFVQLRFPKFRIRLVANQDEKSGLVNEGTETDTGADHVVGGVIGQQARATRLGAAI